jgi:hypothetical protein
MMLADIFIYGALGWYFSKIWPSEYGTQLPWYFLFLPSYWKELFGFKPNDYSIVSSDKLNVELGDIEMVPDSSEIAVENVPASVLAQIAAKTCIQITGLVKEFTTTNGIKRAVDNLNLNIFSGEITALLGNYYIFCLSIKILFHRLRSQWCWQDYNNRNAYWSYSY